MTVQSLAAPGKSGHLLLNPTGQAPMHLVPMDRIIGCKSILDAVHVCKLHDPIRGRTDGYYADHMEIDRSHWSRMMSGNAAPGFDYIAFQRLCKNWAINQYLNYQAGLDTVKRELTTTEKAALYDAMQASA